MVENLAIIGQGNVESLNVMSGYDTDVTGCGSCGVCTDTTQEICLCQITMQAYLLTYICACKCAFIYKYAHIL